MGRGIGIGSGGRRCGDANAMGCGSGGHAVWSRREVSNVTQTDRRIKK